MEDKIFGESGARVVVEEFLTGPEVSVLAFTDGKTIVPMVSSMDHKRALDGDKGPNTGGMGTVAPNPLLHPGGGGAVHGGDLPAHHPGHGRRGAGPSRAASTSASCSPATAPRSSSTTAASATGDPGGPAPAGGEPAGDHAGHRPGTAGGGDVRFADKSACCVILASQGYPGRYETGFPISLPETGQTSTSTSPARRVKDGALVTGGGRCWAPPPWRMTCPPPWRPPTPWRTASTLTTPTAAGISAAGPCGHWKEEDDGTPDLCGKAPGLSPEAGNLLADLRDFLGIRSLAGVRVLNRYDVENIDPRSTSGPRTVVFSEPQADVIWDETFPQPRNAHSLLAVEALPGQLRPAG